MSPCWVVGLCREGMPGRLPVPTAGVGCQRHPLHLLLELQKQPWDRCQKGQLGVPVRAQLSGMSLGQGVFRQNVRLWPDPGERRSKNRLMARERCPHCWVSCFRLWDRLQLSVIAEYLTHFFSH